MKFTLPASQKFKTADFRGFFANLFIKGANRPFILSMCLMLISVFIGLALYYKYLTFNQNEAQNVGQTAQAISFNRGLYYKVLQGIDERSKQFNDAKRPDYRDPFFTGGSSEDKLTR